MTHSRSKRRRARRRQLESAGRLLPSPRSAQDAESLWAGFCVCGSPCPGCGSPVAVPGLLAWVERFVWRTGELPPPELTEAVPPGALWWCSACDEGGVFVPSEEDLRVVCQHAGAPLGWDPSSGA